MVSTNQTYLFNRFFAISQIFSANIIKRYAKTMHRFEKIVILFLETMKFKH